MAIIIRDMDLPKRCTGCPFYSWDRTECILYSDGLPGRYGYFFEKLEERPDWCELEEIKDGS